MDYEDDEAGNLRISSHEYHYQDFLLNEVDVNRWATKNMEPVFYSGNTLQRYL